MSIVPLYFLQEAGVNCPILRIGLSGFSSMDHYRLGQCIAQAVDALGRRAVFVDSGDLETVKRSITLAAGQCHVEVTTLLVPGENDSVEEIRALAQWLAPVERVYRLADEAREYLSFVFTGNC